MHDRIKSIGLTIAGLTSVIVVHEFGHFLFCKIFGVITPIFSVGFGPTLLGTKIGDTFFQIALLPLGGYVAIDPTSIAGRPYIQKLIINSAGIGFNIIFAIILLALFLYIASTKRITPIIEEVTLHSPADKAGLKPEDVISGYNEIPLDTNMTPFLDFIRTSPGTTVSLHIERDNTPQTLSCLIATEHPIFGPNIGWLGARFKQQTGPATSLYTIITQTLRAVITTLQRLTQIFLGLYKKEHRDTLRGPIGIITSRQQLEGLGTYIFMFWLAMINLNVAFFNLLPLPLLDGGHIVQDSIEALYGHPLPPAFMQVLNIVFLCFFLWLMIHVTIRDVKKLKQQRS